MADLLDVNVVIALLDTDHGFHERAHSWWRETQPVWAGCPITENGVVRIMSLANYCPQRKRTVAEVARQLHVFRSTSRHVFWPDVLTITDETLFHRERILTGKHLTDLYLLALAVKNNGRLVTFDRGVPISAVVGARPENLVVL